MIKLRKKLKDDWPRSVERPKWAIEFLRQRDIPGAEKFLTGITIVNIFGSEFAEYTSQSNTVYLGERNHVAPSPQ